VRAHSADRDELRLDNDIYADALAADVERQPGQAAVLDTALKTA
jgi:hypothetical protein